MTEKHKYIYIGNAVCIFLYRWVPEERLKHGCHSHPVFSSTPTRDQSFSDLDISNVSLSDDSFSEQSMIATLRQQWPDVNTAFYCLLPFTCFSASQFLSCYSDRFWRCSVAKACVSFLYYFAL